MGEIAEMHLDGTVCEHCGEYLDGESPGYPRYCSKDCANNAGIDFEENDEEDEATTIDDIECSLMGARVSLEIAIDDLKELKMKGTKELSWLIKRIIQFEERLRK